MKFPLSLLVVSIYLIGFSACLSEKRTPEEDTSSANDTSIVKKEDNHEKIQQIKKIFHSLPSPLELTLLFKEEGIEYNRNKLHPTEKREGYLTSTKKALNLGVYGADLSYTGLFGEHQDAIQYFTVTHLLAAEVGIEQTFEKEFISRLEKNSNNKDTLLNVIGEFFLNNDRYLKDHKQQDISSYVLAGGWIEGMYLGTSMANSNNNSKGIRDIIAGQQPSLKNLIAVLQNIKKNEEGVEFITAIEELESLFPQLVDKEGSQYELSDSSLVVIRKKVASIRSLITN